MASLVAKGEFLLLRQRLAGLVVTVVPLETVVPAATVEFVAQRAVESRSQCLARPQFELLVQVQPFWA